MKSYIFQVELEPDEEGWRAFFPPLEQRGASTWGKTKDEALNNIEEVLSMIIEEFEQEGQSVPITTRMTIAEAPSVTINR